MVEKTVKATNKDMISLPAEIRKKNNILYFNAQYATIRRMWRIREKDTGNFTQFKDNLTQLERV